MMACDINGLHDLGCSSTSQSPGLASLATSTTPYCDKQDIDRGWCVALLSGGEDH